MRRRDFLVGAGLAGWPLCASAQPPARVRHVAVLLGIAENDPETEARLSAFQAGLAELGWSEGRNVKIDYRFGAADRERIRAYASELVAMGPDVIVANTTLAVAALKQTTDTIPIIFAVVNDPVGQGFITNLQRPGGNITGFTFIDFEMIGKWLGLLSELSPPIAKVGLMFGAATAPYYHSYLRAFEAEKATGAVTAIELQEETEIEPTVVRLAQAGSGPIAPADAFNLIYRRAIIAAAARHSVPAVYTYRTFVAEGGLMSYGPETADIFRRAAAYVDRVLRGANPGDLPAQAPSKFEFAINLKTATALGVTIPPNLLARADEVIE
jgi:putative tryptophan/tyrosine transport system substrate-binding protein